MIKANLIIIIVVAALALSAAGFWVVRDIQNAKTAAPVVQNAEKPVSPPVNDLPASPSLGGDDPTAWLQKGILKKNAGDYKGAKEAWEYAAKIRPEDYIAYNNLGDLYHYYLKDYSKAEFYLKKTVELKPDYLQGYTNLHDLYRIFYKEKSDFADDILLEGIKNNQQDYYLRIILASYYKDAGDKQSARKYYEEALRLNPPNKAAIEEELAGLDRQ
ncbi:MAG: hypothetical protein A2941_03315 [Candidatus Yanofskybacteria bacterium RIFCSPLOWO2_01_FULL_49_17]|uniref:Uncharacterized protein n=1 Tax=Candidatus Yanofskybacteria bacterium RIFCSPLOWO2_01_FULL_49_17 TaxID=1802700 RepID=A0A1F8GRV6_9BACT|nr:MAG: hypothetical protein A2941_03315 [Candidatus Yanofskybacteria bacterium RIFCSPLOWO2_01_FULL_49_17]